MGAVVIRYPDAGEGTRAPPLRQPAAVLRKATSSPCHFRAHPLPSASSATRLLRSPHIDRKSREQFEIRTPSA